NAGVSFLNSLTEFVTNGHAGSALIPTPYPCDPYVDESTAFGQAVFIGAGFAIPGFDEAELAAPGALFAEEGPAIQLLENDEDGVALDGITPEDEPDELSVADQRAVRSLQRRIAEHRAKLDAYRADPDAYDNLGVLQGAPSAAARERI